MTTETVGAQIFKNAPPTVGAYRGGGGPVTMDSPAWLRWLAGLDEETLAKKKAEKAED